MKLVPFSPSNRILFLCYLIAAAISTPAFGHGGGLDSYGCHHNRKAGGYHCHREPVAGQSFSSKDEMLSHLKRPSSTLTATSELRGVVVGVTDGDTITVLDGSRKQHKVRLAGIDAPEKHQPFADRARQYMSNLAFRKQATLDCYKTDQYKRKVCRVRVDGKDIALAQVQAGFAWHYKRFEKEQTPSERAAYARGENEARASRSGLWQSNRPVPPWEFRRRK